MNEIILPTVTLTFSRVSDSPQFSTFTSPRWGKATLLGVGYIGNMPTYIGQSVSNTKNYFMYQFNGSDYFACCFSTFSSAVRTPIAFGTNLLMAINDGGSKGVRWTVNYFFNNWIDDFPVPGVPANITYASAQLLYNITDKVCFPEGGISCATSSGIPCVGPGYSGSGATCLRVPVREAAPGGSEDSFHAIERPNR